MAGWDPLAGTPLPNSKRRIPNPTNLHKPTQSNSSKLFSRQVDIFGSFLFSIVARTLHRVASWIAKLLTWILSRWGGVAV